MKTFRAVILNPIAPAKTTGALWFKPDDRGVITIYHWVGGSWVPLYVNVDITQEDYDRMRDAVIAALESEYDTAEEIAEKYVSKAGDTIIGTIFFKNTIEVDKPADFKSIINALGGINANGQHISNLASPIHDTDAATKEYVDRRIATKQDTLVSGTNIKTINNESLLGNGNIDIKDVFIATYNVTPFDDVYAAFNSGKVVICKYGTQVYRATNDEGGEIWFEAVRSGMYVTISKVWVDYNNIWRFESARHIMTSTETESEISVAMSTKQDTLISGTNIKTVNSTSLLGNGNIAIDSDMAASSDELGYIKNKVGGYKIYVPNEDINLDISGYWYDGDELSISISTLLEKGLPQSVIDAIKAKGASCSFNSDSVHITGHAYYSYDESVSDIMFIPDTHEDFQYTHITIDNMCEGGDVDGEDPYTMIPLPGAYVPSKQDKLVSGTNIKTINNQSLLGGGNIEIQGGGGTDNLFIAEYAVTRVSEIIDAYNAGKDIVAKKENGAGGYDFYQLLGYNDSAIQFDFYIIDDSTIKRIYIVDQGGETAEEEWGIGTTTNLNKSDIFWATYNVTTLAQVQSAINSGKLVFVKVDGIALHCPDITSDVAVFTSFVLGYGYISVSLNSNGWQTPVITNPEFQNNKVISIGPASSNIQYPSAKAVYEALSGKQATINTVNVSVSATTGTPSGTASVSGSTMNLSFSGIKGEKGDTGATGPQGPQGNPGSSVDYPFELADNLTTDDPTKALTAAQGVVLDGEISQLRQEAYGINEEILLPSQAYSEINFDTSWGGNTDNIYYDTRLLISPSARIKKVSIFGQHSGTFKVYFIKKSDLSIVTYKEVTLTTTRGWQTFDMVLEDAYYSNGEMYVGINSSTYFGAKTGLSPTTSYVLSITSGTATSNTRSWGILVTTESVANGDIQDLQDDIAELQAEDVSLDGKITDLYNLLYETNVTPSETWIDGSFTIQGGGDANYAFFDTRTAIPAGAKLDRVRMKATASKNITVYLLKASNYSVLTSVVKSVVTGINDITPDFDASFFSTPTYIALGSADSPIAMRDSQGTGETSYTNRLTISTGDVVEGRRYIIAVEVKYTSPRGAGEISPDLDEAIAQGGNDIVLGPYDYEVKSPIVLTSGMTIRGSFGKTRLILTDGCQTAITASNADGIKISDLEIVGTCPDYTVEMNGIVAGTGYDLVETEADAVALNYMGTEKGIYLYYCENVVLENLRINHITGSAIRVNHTGMNYTKGLNACNLFITNCYNGIYCENEHEFSQYTNWTVTSCMIGVYVASGNIIFTAGHATRCRFAMMFVAGTNHAHGVVNGVEIKHNQVAGIFCNGVVYGEFFEGIYLSYSPLVIRDSTGVYFDDIMVGNMSIDVTGTTGVNKIGKLVKRNNGISMVNTDTLTILETVELY